MPSDDLDLEFEDEEDSKKKKSEAFQVDADLEFQAPQGVERPRQMPQKPQPPAGAPPMRPPQKPPATVQRIDEARAAQSPVKRPAGPPGSVPSTPRSIGSSALSEDFDLDSQQIVELRAHVHKVEFEAEVKVAVAEFKTEILSELNGDTKLMEHQINQLLVRVNAKHPDLKQEMLMIKKILADFTTKKRK